MLKEAIERIMKETGRISETGRIQIEEIQNNTGSDYAKVIVNCYRKRCRKPFLCWEIIIFLPKDQILWNQSSFYYI